MNEGLNKKKDCWFGLASKGVKLGGKTGVRCRRKKPRYRVYVGCTNPRYMN